MAVRGAAYNRLQGSQTITPHTRICKGCSLPPFARVAAAQHTPFCQGGSLQPLARVADDHAPHVTPAARMLAL